MRLKKNDEMENDII